MSNTQPEALRLAREFEDLYDVEERPIDKRAAAELRHLHDIEIEYATLRTLAASYEKEHTRLQSLNSELLEALRAMLNESVCLRGDSIPSDTLARARAAIAKAEGQQ